MLNGCLIDLGSELEIVSYYSKDAEQAEQLRIQETKTNDDLLEDRLKKRAAEESAAANEEENKERAERRAKTQVRRLCKRYDMRYMWTLTIRERHIKIKNPTNNRVSKVDAGDSLQVWKLWKLFLQRCRADGFDFNYIVVAELQEERLEKRGEQVYHFHFATDKPMPINKQFAHGQQNYVTKYWDFGFVKVTKRKSNKKMANVYLMKYISKNFESAAAKGRQRYRVKEGLTIPKTKLPAFTYKNRHDFNRQLIEYAEQFGKIACCKHIETDEGIPIIWMLIDRY